MKIQLTTIIDLYFEYSNTRESMAILKCFKEDAFVHDDSKDMYGKEQVKAWIEKVLHSYMLMTTPVEIETKGNIYIVVAKVEGNFPGSPIFLKHTFLLQHGLISQLDIRS